MSSPVLESNERHHSPQTSPDPPPLRTSLLHLSCPFLLTEPTQLFLSRSGQLRSLFGVPQSKELLLSSSSHCCQFRSCCLSRCIQLSALVLAIIAVTLRLVALYVSQSCSSCLQFTEAYLSFPVHGPVPLFSIVVCLFSNPRSCPSLLQIDRAVPLFPNPFTAVPLFSNP